MKFFKNLFGTQPNTSNTSEQKPTDLSVQTDATQKQLCTVCG
jgi:hypothetical protein